MRQFAAWVSISILPAVVAAILGSIGDLRDYSRESTQFASAYFAAGEFSVGVFAAGVFAAPYLPPDLSAPGYFPLAFTPPQYSRWGYFQ